MHGTCVHRYRASVFFNKRMSMDNNISQLNILECESIHIIREALAYARNPVLLHSLGKDSMVLLHLAMKAFMPAEIPFPIMHIDTQWKFSAMYEFRKTLPDLYNVELITWINPEWKDKINPFIDGSDTHTRLMKTEALKQALDNYEFDIIFCGARRDEDMSRAKERIFSVRNKYHQWDPKSQRPELWNHYNTKLVENSSIRVFPLSNWTERDIWMYIKQENIPVVPLYFSDMRKVVDIGGNLILVDDDRLPINDIVEVVDLQVRFRSLGCYPLTFASRSSATTVDDIIEELATIKTSERFGRAIDSDRSSMEDKKKDGYF